MKRCRECGREKPKDGYQLCRSCAEDAAAARADQEDTK